MAFTYNLSPTPHADPEGTEIASIWNPEQDTVQQSYLYYPSFGRYETLEATGQKLYLPRFILSPMILI